MPNSVTFANITYMYFSYVSSNKTIKEEFRITWRKTWIPSQNVQCSLKCHGWMISHTHVTVFLTISNPGCITQVKTNMVYTETTSLPSSFLMLLNAIFGLTQHSQQANFPQTLCFPCYINQIILSFLIFDCYKLPSNLPSTGLAAVSLVQRCLSCSS